ncbi:hypothetical protein [Streptomyces scabiei]|uniref:hypothetical protein n=2 Tax=Streptomyces scabiei TaxID=1930 RepID=UPI0004E648AA|nr:hypothetical protein [Streptomyces scabiei]KFG05594.1 hypothetical protein IQ61_29335 [Streptomyces scabiei]MDX2829456.1 hypothetical protein [Streptomyces scabiei]
MMLTKHRNALGGTMRRTTTLTAVLAAGLLLTACIGDSDNTSKPSATPEKATTPTVEESVIPGQDAAEDAADKAEKDYEKSLKDLEDALGETIGVQEGTYEVTNSPPDYDDPAEALDDEYIAPGTYTTKGPADPAYDCYWARMKDASTQSIIANDLTGGRALVELKEGDFFKTSACKPWTRSGD